MFYEFYASPLGEMTLASNDKKSLCALFFSEQNSFKNPLEFYKKDCEIFLQTKAWLDVYFSGQKPDFTPKIDLNVSEFKMRVYEHLPSYAQSSSYGLLAKNLAKKLGKNKISAQAIGAALAKNPILLIIPCHRVLGANAELKGYTAGIWRKKELLKLEKIDFKE